MATQAQHAVMLSDLIATLRADGCRFYFQNARTDVLAGFFDEPRCVGVYEPEIWLGRAEPDVPGPLPRELGLLAHEVGHFRSHNGGTRSGRFREVNRHPYFWRELPRSDRQVLLDEEIRAWNLGAMELARVGFVDWPAYRAQALENLALYEHEARLTAHPDALAFPSSDGPWLPYHRGPLLRALHRVRRLVLARRDIRTSAMAHG